LVENIPNKLYFSEEYDEEEEEDCVNPINLKSSGFKLEHRFKSNTARTTAKRRKQDEESVLEIEQDNSVPVLMDIAKELRDLNRQTRLNAQRSEANTEALLALGSQVTDLMQQQLKERKRLNAIMEKFVLKMESAE